MRERPAPEKIAVDAMGGDFAPERVVEGSLLACREYGIPVILVGERKRLEEEIERHGGIADLPVEIVHAPEVIHMDEPAIFALRRKKNSSITVSASLVKRSMAGGVVSAGNTGASMAAMKLSLGCIEGVGRPALAVTIPTLRGNAVLLDVGANVECKPHNLQQFAIMGDIYARNILSITNPRIGLLSIGEEDIKGNELTRETLKILRESRLNFIGNIEGHHIYNGEADVIVCDGFTGNIVLKTSESLIHSVEEILKNEIKRSHLAKFGILLAMSTLKKFKRKLDYSEYGGAFLVGLNGICIICHGSSNPKAIKNAIRIARDFSLNGLNKRIHSEVEKYPTPSRPNSNRT